MNGICSIECSLDVMGYDILVGRDNVYIWITVTYIQYKYCITVGQAVRFPLWAGGLESETDQSDAPT